MDARNLLVLALITGMTMMALLALEFLRRRALRWEAHLFLGLLAIFLPVAGPFLAILLAPGCFLCSRQVSMRR